MGSRVLRYGLWMFLSWNVLWLPNLALGMQSTEPAVEVLFKQAYEQSAKDRSAEPLKAMVDEHFTGVLMTLGAQGQESVTGLAGLQQHFAHLKDLIGNGTYTLQVHPDEPTDAAGDMASVHGSLDCGIVTGQGAEYHLTNLWTAVFRRQGGQWKLLRLQESLDPVSNPLVMGVKHDLIIRVSFIALIVGMVLGWLFRRLFSGRPTGDGGKDGGKV